MGSRDIDALMSKLGVSSGPEHLAFVDKYNFVVTPNEPLKCREPRSGGSPAAAAAAAVLVVPPKTDPAISTFRAVFRKHFRQHRLIDFSTVCQEAEAVFQNALKSRSKDGLSQMAMKEELLSQLESEKEWIKAVNDWLTDNHRESVEKDYVKEFRQELQIQYPLTAEDDDDEQVRVYEEADILKFSQALVERMAERFLEEMPPFVDKSRLTDWRNQLCHKLCQLEDEMLADNQRKTEKLWEEKVRAASEQYNELMGKFFGSHLFASKEVADKFHGQAKMRVEEEHGLLSLDHQFHREYRDQPNLKSASWDLRVNEEYRDLERKWNIVKCDCRKSFKREFGFELSEETSLELSNNVEDKESTFLVRDVVAEEPPLNMSLILEKVNASTGSCDDDDANSSSARGSRGDVDRDNINNHSGNANWSNMDNSSSFSIPIPIVIPCGEEELDRVVSPPLIRANGSGRNDENDNHDGQDEESRVTAAAAPAESVNSSFGNVVPLSRPGVIEELEGEGEGREVLVPSPRRHGNNNQAAAASLETPGTSASTLAALENPMEFEDETGGGDDDDAPSESCISARRRRSTRRKALPRRYTRQVGRRDQRHSQTTRSVRGRRVAKRNAVATDKVPGSHINSQSGGENSMSYGMTVVDGVSPRDLVKPKHSTSMEDVVGSRSDTAPHVGTANNKFTSVAIGVDDVNYVIVFPANSPLPTAVVDVPGGTLCDNQASVVSTIYEGDYPAPDTAEYLAEMYFPEIPPSEAGMEHLECKMGIDECGMLHVKWGVRSTGQMFHRSIRTSAWCRGTTPDGAAACQSQQRDATNNSTSQKTWAPIGVLGDDKSYDVIIQANTPLPSVVYRSSAVPSSNDATTDKLSIHEGEQGDPTFKKLGEMLWTDIPPTHGGGWEDRVKLDFTMQLDARGMLLVEWEVRGSGRKFFDTFKTSVWSEYESADRATQEEAGGPTAGGSSNKRSSGATHGASDTTTSKKVKLEVSGEVSDSD